MPVVQQCRRHVLDREHMIDEAAGRGTLRHAALGVVVELGLAEREAAMLLDGGHAQRPVAAEAGEDDADRILALVLGERGEEGVDRGAAGEHRRRTGEVQHAALDRQDGVRRDDVNLVRADRRPIRRGMHRHRRVAGHDRGQRAFVMRIEMLDQHERHAAVGRHLGEERLEGVEPARRGADAHDQARLLGCHNLIGVRLMRGGRGTPGVPIRAGAALA